MGLKFIAGWLLYFGCVGLHAACPSWSTQERFMINGAEVIDKRTGLVWARCSVGQTWSGSTCTGSVSYMTHEAALQHAQAQAGWRLPSVKELASLADKGCQYPSIDSTAFPIPSNGDMFWSSTPDVRISNVLVVRFSIGDFFQYIRYGVCAVRLVRSS